MTRGSGTRRRRAVRLTLALAMAAAVAGCAPTGPTPDPGKAIRFENRTATTIAISIGQRGGSANGPLDGTMGLTGFQAIIAPCGGSATAIPGVDGAPRTDWLIFILLDLTGELDRSMAEVNNDASALPRLPPLAIGWSTGEIEPADLPRTVTVTPTDVTVMVTPDPAPILPPCAPWDVAHATAAVR